MGFEVKWKSDKVSVNINPATLASIDLLVENGYYSNRSDFINQALRSAIEKNQNTIDQIIEQHRTKHRDDGNWMIIGVGKVSMEDVMKWEKSDYKIRISVFGMLSIDDKVDTDRFFNVVESIEVVGKVFAKTEIKTHYGLK